MSNIIKSRFIYLNDDEKRIIDSNEISERFRLVGLNKQFSAHGSNETAAAEESKDGFTEGLKVTVIDRESLEADDELIKLKNEQLIEEAKEKAAAILQEAEQKAKEASEAIFEDARDRGYQDGMQNALVKTQEKQNELDELINTQNKDYLEQINNLEQDFAHITAFLIEKITGILVEDKNDIICYLIHKAIMNADNSKTYVIRVSGGDYEAAMSKKVEMEKNVKEEVSLDIVLDKELEKNQCMIETDTNIIDCSLDMQLSSLVQDIKLLALKKS